MHLFAPLQRSESNRFKNRTKSAQSEFGKNRHSEKNRPRARLAVWTKIEKSPPILGFFLPPILPGKPALPAILAGERDSN